MKRWERGLELGEPGWFGALLVEGVRRGPELLAASDESRPHRARRAGPAGGVPEAGPGADAADPLRAPGAERLPATAAAGAAAAFHAVQARTATVHPIASTPPTDAAQAGGAGASPALHAGAPTRSFEGALGALLHSSGVALGRSLGGEPGPVAARTEPEAAFVELLRFMLATGATILGSAADPHDTSRPAGGGAGESEGDAAARERRTVLELAALAGAFAGEVAAAEALLAAASQERASGGDASGGDAGQERRLVGIVGARLVRRAYLLGNPPGGLPLHAALATLDARAFARLARARARGAGPLRALAHRHQMRLSRSRALAVEALAALAWVDGPPPAESLRIARRQVRAVTLLAPDRRGALRAVDEPRPLAQVLVLTPAPLRRVLVEQTVVAALVDGVWSPRLRALVAGEAAQAGVAERDMQASEEAAVAAFLQHADTAFALAAAPHELRGALDSAEDSLRETAAAVAEEIRETGDLGLLLARMAQGEQLNDEERRRLRRQLVDLAKVVPSLAVFAAPGGMLLLPVLLRLLPFDLRPSAFQSPRSRSADMPTAAGAPAAETARRALPSVAPPAAAQAPSATAGPSPAEGSDASAMAGRSAPTSLRALASAVAAALKSAALAPYALEPAAPEAGPAAGAPPGASREAKSDGRKE